MSRALRFVHHSRPGRVAFGVGRLDALRDEVGRLGAGHALVVSTPGRRALGEDAAARLGDLAVGVDARAAAHVPMETARAGVAAAERLGADCVVAVGGGSAIGLAKAIALHTAAPIVAVPTTYSGSEMTDILGLTENGVKRTVRDPRILPRTVIYDPALSVGLPAAASGASGMNALAHCMEALYAADASPVTSLLAEEGARALGAGLPRVVGAPDDLTARGLALYGAWLAGASLGAVAMALHHKLCHALGGLLNLPHADTHTIMLPHSAAYNAPAAPEAMARIARALGAASAPTALFDLARALSAPAALKDLGVAEANLDRVADLALLHPYANPREVTRDGVLNLLQDAWEGRRPAPAA